MNKDSTTQDNKPDYESIIKECLNVKELVQAIKQGKVELKAQKAEANKYGYTQFEQFEYMIDTLANDWEGIYIPTSVVRAFPLLFPEYEGMDRQEIIEDDWLWESIDSAMSGLSRYLETLPTVKKALGKKYGLSFGNLSECGDYGLILYLSL
jgi:hypothetical protein